MNKIFIFLAIFLSGLWLAPTLLAQAEEDSISINYKREILAKLSSRNVAPISIDSIIELIQNDFTLSNKEEFLLMLDLEKIRFIQTTYDNNFYDKINLLEELEDKYKGDEKYLLYIALAATYYDIFSANIERAINNPIQENPDDKYSWYLKT